MQKQNEFVFFGNRQESVFRKYFKKLASGFVVLTAAASLTGCNYVMNSPRETADYAANTLFSSFSGRSPRTLDPQASYSSDETIYTYNVYEAPYTYHYLKRPYELRPRTAEAVVKPVYLDKNGKVLPDTAESSDIDVSLYRIAVKKGIRYAPHPAFAKNAQGEYLYHHLPVEEVARLTSPLELPEKGTRELTAEDYVYGIKRMADPKVGSPVLGLMGEHIVGLNELHAALRDNLKAHPDARWTDLRNFPFEGARAVDEHTLEIRVKGKYPQFDNWLAMAFFAPMPWEAEAFYAQDGFAQNNITLATWPVGTGPYMLTESRVNREYVLKRNPNYRFDPYPCEGELEDAAKGFLADCGKPMPFIDTIVMTMEKEAVPTTTKFLQGYYDSPQITRLDVGQGFLVAAGDDPDKAKLYKDKELQFPTTVEANLWYIGFNWLDPIVGEGKTPVERERNKKLRQAISIAIDWEEQIAIFEKGQGQPAHGPLPPGLFGYDDNGASAFNPVVYKKTADGRVVRRSIEEAKILMREAGYPDGRDAKTGQPLVLNFDWQGASPGSKAFLEWFKRQFAKIDIQLEIRATDYNRFQEKMMTGAAQIYYWGWLADYPDAENFLFLLYGPNSKVGTGGGGENASNYVNAEFDKRFDRMKYLENGPEKAKLINEMIAILQDDAVWSFGYFPTSAAALHQWVKNAKPTQMIRNNVQFMRIDYEKRAQKIAEWNRPILWPVLLILVLMAAGVVFVWRHMQAMAKVRGLTQTTDRREGGLS